MKPEVLKKGLAMICIMDISKAPVNFNFQFFAVEKNKRLMEIALIKQT